MSIYEFNKYDFSQIDKKFEYLKIKDIFQLDCFKKLKEHHNNLLSSYGITHDNIKIYNYNDFQNNLPFFIYCFSIGDKVFLNRNLLNQFVDLHNLIYHNTKFSSFILYEPLTEEQIDYILNFDLSVICLNINNDATFAQVISVFAFDDDFYDEYFNQQEINANTDHQIIIDSKFSEDYKDFFFYHFNNKDDSSIYFSKLNDDLFSVFIFFLLKNNFLFFNKLNSNKNHCTFIFNP